MRDNKRGTIEDRSIDKLLEQPAVRIPVQDENAEIRTAGKFNDLYTRLSVLEGVMERLLARIAGAEDLADVNIAAGIAAQELADV